MWAETGRAQATSPPSTNEIWVVELQGTVEISPAGARTWIVTQTNQFLHPFDRLRTATNSRVALRWSNQSIVSFGAATELEVLPPYVAGAQSGLRLVQGILSFFHRDTPSRIRVITRGAVAGVEGTEFVVAVADVNGSERTTLSVLDGRVSFGNELATLMLAGGEQATAELGEAPVRTPGFIANNVLQWCFYYPAVLDLADLPLTAEEERDLEESRDAYRSGDLLSALARYPPSRLPGSDAERVYYAALLLSVGQVEPAEEQLASLSEAGVTARPQKLAVALRELISAVKHEPDSSIATPQLPTEFLAKSYHEQSRSLGQRSLNVALNWARAAAVRSPESGFAWARMAELEFSFGRTTEALAALNHSLALAPRNAQALALKGFLLAAQNRTRDAILWFDRALAVDSALGNAWLGRGLCRIRRGDANGGREDLLVAAALEPQRAELRSYLGKADANTGNDVRAARELQLAKQLDPNDPTAWLYSALLNQQKNRINEAIRDLEKSQTLNDNRSLYRSRLLLDQDRAVRSANLAAIYEDAGMTDVAVREAARAVNHDYGNYSAHLFLADSFRLGLGNQTSQRYETASEVEFLLANLLAPVGAGTLSPALSRSEYSRLFERNRLGIVSTTEYLSRGAWTESGAQYGTFEKVGYDLEWLYASDPGQRANHDFELWQLRLQLKLQLSPKDGLYVRVKKFESRFGDLAQYYDPSSANPDVRFKETQDPIVSLGYRHEWNPGVNTLFFATRLDDTLSFTNPSQPTLVAFRPDLPTIPSVTELTAVHGITIQEQFAVNLEIYSAELQQIWQRPAHNTVLGVRVQYGQIDTMNLQTVPSDDGGVFDPGMPAAQQDLTSLYRRVSLYGYHQWSIFEPLQLIGGVSYDRITFPENFRNAPVSDREESAETVSPKAGLIWTPTEKSTVRFAYTRSLAGASLDQSYQIEPSQVAGFIQSFRSIIPESIAGANAGARFETYGISLEQKFDAGTYLGISAEILNSELDRTLGAFDVLPDQFDWAVPSGLRNHLDYEERSLVIAANQLLGHEWSLGARYRLSQSIMKNDFVGVADGLFFSNFQPRQRLESILHELNLFAVFNHRAGFHATTEARFYSQNNRGDAPNQPGDDFWQLNLLAGYRFPRRQAEIQIGLLNITDQDYRLSPLNLHGELPRQRTLAVRFRLNY